MKLVSCATNWHKPRRKTLEPSPRWLRITLQRWALRAGYLDGKRAAPHQHGIRPPRSARALALARSVDGTARERRETRGTPCPPRGRQVAHVRRALRARSASGRALAR